MPSDTGIPATVLQEVVIPFYYQRHQQQQQQQRGGAMAGLERYSIGSGRMDIVLHTPGLVYVLELKIHGRIADAEEQLKAYLHALGEDLKNENGEVAGAVVYFSGGSFTFKRHRYNHRNGTITPSDANATSTTTSTTSTTSSRAASASAAVALAKRERER